MDVLKWNWFYLFAPAAIERQLSFSLSMFFVSIVMILASIVTL